MAGNEHEADRGSRTGELVPQTTTDLHPATTETQRR